MKFMGYKVSGIPADAPVGATRVVDTFDLRDAAIECAQLMVASGQWRDVECMSLSVNGESSTTYPVLFGGEVPA